MLKRRISKRTKSSINERRVYVNTALPQDALDSKNKPRMLYPSNEVVTSKYSLLSFLPKNLFEQFRRLANMFFLALIILQCFPEFITVEPIIAAMPTIIIVLVTAMKDGFEDYKRHTTDKQVNGRTAYSLPRWNNVNYSKGKKRESILSNNGVIRQFLGHSKVQPRDLESSIKDNDQMDPSKEKETSSPNTNAPERLNIADVKTVAKLGGLEEDEQKVIDRVLDQQSIRMSGLLDPSTMEDAWESVKWSDLRVGDFVFMRNNEFIPADVVIVSTSEPDSVCYVETKNLDGETNLKVRKGMSETSHIQYPQQCRDLKLNIKSEPPSNNMFTFNALVSISHNGLPDWNTKIPPIQVPINMNGVILRGCVLRNTSWVIGIVAYTGNQTKLRLNSGETPSKRSIIERKMNPQIMVNLFIMASICIVCAAAGNFWTRYAKSVDSPYLPQDGDYNFGYVAFIAFWSALTAFQNIVPISLYLTVEIVKTLQAYFIYSDIKMYYKELDLPCVPKSWNLADDLGQIEYVFSDKTGTLTQNVMEFRRCSINGVVYGAPLITTSTPIISAVVKAQFMPPDDYIPPSRYGSKTPQFYDALLFKDMNNEETQHAQMICEFWRLLGICHTVLVSSPDQTRPFDISYKAQSPDEAALVDASKEVGFTFIGRHMTEILLDVMGDEEQYTLLAVLEFNSTRKRMSIVARRPDGVIVLYCKGADSVIFERLGGNTSQLVQEVTLKHLEIFADEGLRTLCLAYRIIPDEEFIDWIGKYNDACTSIYDREDKIDQTAELIERDFVLLGATAIEDRLQAGVPECIQTLRDAGIKVWVLTGDKMETAISIGLSCNLLAKNTNLIVIKGGAPDNPQFVMDQIKTAFNAFFAVPSVGSNVIPDSSTDLLTDRALVIDGSALKVALEDVNKSELLALASRCQVVICCRVSPLQKAQVVSLVKDGLDAVTLAIGDGANDVSMIQAAHIGIGIAGEEGMQAVMASDYAIAQFRYLARLLLVHGRWSYHRVTELTFNYFYKNIIFVFVIFWFQFWSGYSTQAPYEFSYMLFYNLFFTNWPVMVLGIFDQDVPESVAIQVPKLYQSGIKQTLFTNARFALYMGDGLYQSLVCYFIPLGVYWYSQASWYGGTCADLIELGTTMAASSITSANLYVALHTRTFTFINHVAIWVASIAVFYTYLIVTFEIDSPNTKGLGRILWSSPLFYLGTLLSITLSILPRFVYKFACQTFYPTDVDIACEVYKYNLDMQHLLPKPIVLEEPETPPSAHPNNQLHIQIPDVPSQHASTEQLDLMTTPEIMQLNNGLVRSATGNQSRDLGRLPQSPSAPILDQSSKPNIGTTINTEFPNVPRQASIEITIQPGTPESVSNLNQSAKYTTSSTNQRPGTATLHIDTANKPNRPIKKAHHLRSLTLCESITSQTDLHSPTLTTPNSIKAMSVSRNRGFSFSTDESGVMRNLLMAEYTPTLASSPVMELGMSVQAQKYVKKHTKPASSDWEIYKAKTPDSAPPTHKRKFVVHAQTNGLSSQPNLILLTQQHPGPVKGRARGHVRAHSTGVILNHQSTNKYTNKDGPVSINTSPHGPSSLRTEMSPSSSTKSPKPSTPIRSTARSPSGLRNDAADSIHSTVNQSIHTIAEESHPEPVLGSSLYPNNNVNVDLPLNALSQDVSTNNTNSAYFSVRSLNDQPAP